MNNIIKNDAINILKKLSEQIYKGTEHNNNNNNIDAEFVYFTDFTYEEQINEIVENFEEYKNQINNLNKNNIIINLNNFIDFLSNPEVEEYGNKNSYENLLNIYTELKEKIEQLNTTIFSGGKKRKNKSKKQIRKTRKQRKSLSLRSNKKKSNKKTRRTKN